MHYDKSANVGFAAQQPLAINYFRMLFLPLPVMARGTERKKVADIKPLVPIVSDLNNVMHFRCKAATLGAFITGLCKDNL